MGVTELPESLKSLVELHVSLLDHDVLFEQSIDLIENRFPVKKSCIKWKVPTVGVFTLILSLAALYCARLSKQLFPEDELRVSASADEAAKIAVGNLREPVEVPDSSVDQIVQRMKAMRLPAISFRPPATMLDAVEFFQQASRDFDDPKLAQESRGFKFCLIASQSSASTDDSEGGFGDDADDDPSGVASNGPAIPQIAASDISFYDALMLVCECVDYRFEIRHGHVYVLPSDGTVDPMQTRIYEVRRELMEVLALYFDHDRGRSSLSSKGRFDGEDDATVGTLSLREFFDEYEIKPILVS